MLTPLLPPRIPVPLPDSSYHPSSFPTMKRYILILLALASSAMAQITPPGIKPATPETFVTGTLNIDYATRVSEGKNGVVDTYRFDVNVSNSSKFHGTITQLPFKAGTMGTNYGSQSGNLTYDFKLDVLNPKNPAQSLNVGIMAGTVPVNAQNVYDFDRSNLTTRVFARGTAKGFDSPAKGVALGKPPTPAKGLIDRLKPAMTFTKQVGGQQQRIVVTRYDIMEFRNHVLPAGPVQIYGESVVNGKAVFGYDRNCWYFDRLVITYVAIDANGHSTEERETITGDIRWVEDPNRKTNGIGEYQLDLRVNEKPPAEDAQFAPPSDEASFFTSDASVKGLSGTIKYLDKMTSDGDSCTASAITIDLHGNQLTKIETMNLAKLILFSLTVPFNAE